ncbi:hypothetical protein GCM10022419_041330 [Nonomuraea rosea]|uniref:Lactococcin 972 family bacteriocin n=1 Tax=Nonomuraea rosea TaxID=638574 RepID=A0ABP6WTQ4_9ACTN
MKGSLIAAGGALLAAAVLFGTAGTAAADTWTDWNHQYPDHCGLGVNEDTTYHHVTHHGVFAGTRDADGCKGGAVYGWGWNNGHQDHGHDSWGEHHWKHRNWPTSGNGNWVGHGFGPGVGIGVGR